MARFQLHLNDRLFGAAREEMDQIHRVAGGLDAHVVGSDLDVIGSNGLLDEVERLEYLWFGLLNACAGSCLDAQTKHGAIHVREDLGAQTRDKDHKEQRTHE